MKKKLLLSLFIIPFLVGCNNVAPENTDNGDDDSGEIDTKNYWPSNQINSFLNEKEISGVTIPYIELNNSEFISCEEKIHDDYSYLSIIISNDKYSDYVSALNGAHYVLEDEYYVDPSEQISISLAKTSSTKIDVYSLNDLIIPDLPGDNEEEEEEENLISSTYDLHNKIGTSESSTLSYIDSEVGVKFTFDKNGSQYNPKSQKGSSGYVAMYANNTLTISNKNIKKAEFTFNSDKTPDISSSTGELVKKDNYNFVWSGESDNLVITANSQSRLINLTIYYNDKEEENPSLTGVSTIKEVYEAASKINYLANASGWYLSNVEVTLRVEAIDAIDSTTTSGLDGNARGKVLCVDETGYIIVSSGISKNNPISFYQRVKDYLKQGTTQYEVIGHIAFLNGVVEVKVDSYNYMSSLHINKDYESYYGSTYTKSSELVNDIINNTIPNEAGYGVNKVIKMTGLTYFNKYNSAGSYLFIDRDGEIVPIYSMLDMARDVLIKGQCYDIIGLETLYRNRPSLRILDVSRSSLEGVSFDFENNVTEVTSLNSFYSIKKGTSENYVRSELTVYKVDAYVSRYAEDSYTFNTSFYYDSTRKEFTTGSSQVNAANKNALGIFNEDLTYKQILLDYLLENCSSQSECEDKKVTLYFTLAFADVVDGKTMWRVNIFEDLVYSLDYYKSDSKTVEFVSGKNGMVHTYEEHVWQSWSKDGITVKNETTSVNVIKRDPTMLKIVDGTKLTISFSSPIIGFTLYHKTYSYISGLIGLNIKAYKQTSSYTTIILKEKLSTIVVEDFMVGGNRTSSSLNVESLTINF